MSRILPVILAAGMGTRLNINEPKCLTKVKELPLIFHSIIALSNLDIDEIVLVVGEKKDTVMNQIGHNIYGMKVTYVENDAFYNSGTAYSLLCAKETILNNSVDLLMLHGDIFYDPNIFKNFFSKTESTIFLDSRYKTITNDEMIVFGKNDLVHSIIKGPDLKTAKENELRVLGESLGINLFKNNMLNILFENLELNTQINKQIHWEQCIETLVQSYNLELKYYDISPLKWININYREDLETAQNLAFT